MKTFLLSALISFSTFTLLAQDCGSVRDCFLQAYSLPDFNKRLAEMQKVFVRAEQENVSDSAMAYMNTALGLTHIDLKRPKAARPYLMKAIELDPENKESALMGMGLSYFALRNYDDSRKYFNQLVAANEKNVFGWYYKGLSDYYQNKDESALQNFLNAQKLIPVRTWKITETDTLFSMQMGDTSIPKATRSDIHFHVGLLKVFGGNGNESFKAGISEFNKALVDNPSNDAALRERGKCYYYLQIYEKAKADLNKAVKLNKNNKYGWYTLGMSHYYSKGYAQAANCLAKAREIDPNFHRAVYYEGMAIWYYAVDHKDQWSDLYQRIKGNFDYVIRNAKDAKLVQKTRNSLNDLMN